MNRHDKITFDVNPHVNMLFDSSFCLIDIKPEACCFSCSTQQKQQEDLLEKNTKMAKDISAAKSSFLAKMSYEMRTLL